MTPRASSGPIGPPRVRRNQNQIEGFRAMDGFPREHLGSDDVEHMRKESCADVRKETGAIVRRNAHDRPALRQRMPYLRVAGERRLGERRSGSARALRERRSAVGTEGA